MSTLTNTGREVFDQTPVSIKVPFERPLPLHLRIRQQIIQALQAQNELSEVETPEEADDFSVDDDPDMWSSPYEGDFDHINKPLNEVFESKKSEDEKPEDEKPEGEA